MKRGHVPGNIGRNTGHKLSQAPQFIVAVVESGDQQRHNLQPDTHLVQAANGVENRLQPSAELAIMAIVEALQIHFVQIYPRMQILQHLRRPVTVRNERCLQPGFARMPENLNCPLARDERLVISAHQHLRALPQRIFHQQLWIGLARRTKSHPGRAVPVK